MSDKLTVKVLPSHREVLQRLAAAEGEPISVVVRKLIRAEALRRGLWPPSDRPREQAREVHDER